MLAGPQHDVLVLAPAILSGRRVPVAALAAAANPSVADRLDVGHVLRMIARDRVGVTVLLRDGSRLAGTIDRVGADFLDLAEHLVGEPRRARQVSGLRMVAFAGLAAVRAG
jgi:hypothetical protein